MNNLKIQKLPQDVVNKIAAGEVIHRPCNALKELLENALDSKASKVQVVCSNQGGLKLLQIQDNGTGIKFEDFPLLCERHATSKLQSFQQLQQGHVQTFGFRGEALASISHCSHLTVITQTAAMDGNTENEVAYEVKYMDGRIVSSFSQQNQQNGDMDEKQWQKWVKQCAGVGSASGTIIKVEDLFYSVPMRRKAFPNTQRCYLEEYQKIVQCVQHYALHNCHVAFSCKRLGQSGFDINTAMSASAAQLTDGITTTTTTIQQDHRLKTIRLLYGHQIANGAMQLNAKNEQLNVKISGYFRLLDAVNLKSNATSQLILFINDRLVDSPRIKRALDAGCQSVNDSGKQKSHYWAYIALSMDGNRVDINVHPTKREVHMLNELEICEYLTQLIRELLTEKKQHSEHLKLNVQQLNNCQSSQSHKQSEKDAIFDGDSQVQESSTVDELTINQSKVDLPENTGRQKVSVTKLVRTDAKARTLDSFRGFQLLKPQISTMATQVSSAGSYVNVDPSLLSGNGASASTQDSPFQRNLRAVNAGSLSISASAANVEQVVPQSVYDQAAISILQTKDNVVDGQDQIAGQTIDNSNAAFQKGADVAADRLENAISCQSEEALVADSSQERIEVTLGSVMQLREQILGAKDEALTSIVCNHTFVGVLDQKNALIQHDTALLMLNYHELSYQFFYQLVLRDFANFGQIKLQPQPLVSELIAIALRVMLNVGLQVGGYEKLQLSDVNRLAKDLAQKLIAGRDMLADYFSVLIEPTGHLSAITMLLADHSPQMTKLPLFILRCCTEVNYEDELDCLGALSREIALFYQLESESDDRIASNSDNSNELNQQLHADHDDGRVKQLLEVIKVQCGHSLKHNLIDMLPCVMHQDDVNLVSTVAELGQLYRVFERC